MNIVPLCSCSVSGGTEPWTRERSLADNAIQSQAGSALSRKASLHFKTKCSHDQGDDLATRDGVFGGILLYSILGRRPEGEKLVLRRDVPDIQDSFS